MRDDVKEKLTMVASGAGIAALFLYGGYMQRLTATKLRADARAANAQERMAAAQERIASSLEAACEEIAREKVK